MPSVVECKTTTVKQLAALPKNQILPNIAILLCTFNGQRYLAEQLDSFAWQTYSNWKVWASDDGSTDNTLAILGHYREGWGEDRLSILRGPKKGFVANYLSLTCNDDIQADFYAYSDQDDVWLEKKLERALNWISTVPDTLPALYCARTCLVDEQCNDIGFSPLFSKAPSFKNALIQSIAGGNTMLFNNAARKLLCEAGSDIGVVTHDWWAYMVVSGCGGRVIFDFQPTILYRQHQDNLVGMNSNWSARFTRIYMLFQGRFRLWNDANIHALQRLESKLTPESRNVLSQFSSARSKWFLLRVIRIMQSGVFRQTIFGNLGLFIAAVFNKI